MQLKKAAISTQCAWRVRVAKKELKKLKMVRCNTYIIPLFLLLFFGNVLGVSNVTVLLMSKSYIWKAICYFRRILIKTYLPQAAKETGALQAAKNKLEKQVEDLTLRLQLERRTRVCHLLCVLFTKCN